MNVVIEGVKVGTVAYDTGVFRTNNEELFCYLHVYATYCDKDLAYKNAVLMLNDGEEEPLETHSVEHNKDGYYVSKFILKRVVTNEEYKQRFIPAIKEE